jgi:hypothetical protein
MIVKNRSQYFPGHVMIIVKNRTQYCPEHVMIIFKTQDPVVARKRRDCVSKQDSVAVSNSKQDSVAVSNSK